MRSHSFVFSSKFQLITKCITSFCLVVNSSCSRFVVFVELRYIVFGNVYSEVVLIKVYLKTFCKLSKRNFNSN